jgi:putative ABC transport system permease protein
MASRVDPVHALKSGGKGTSDAAGSRRVQSALIVAQVAVSVVLLIGAGLLLLSFYRLQSVEAGFKADRVMSAEVFGNFTKYPDARSVRRLYTSILERLETAPGVVSAAVTNSVPLSGVQPGNTRFRVNGRAYNTPDERPTADIRVASPKYFDTLGIPIRVGRGFEELDHENAQGVAIINEAMVRQWDGRNAIGSQITFTTGDNEPVWLTIVGVAGDVKTFGLDRDAVAQVYVPLRQAGQFPGRVLVRVNGEPSQAIALIRDAVRAVDADVPIENVRTLDEIRDRYLATPRLTALLLTVFATLALLVTVTGITGVIAQSVSQRTSEFGLRMALGATQRSVLAMVLRQGLILVGVGLVIGIGGAMVFARVLETYLYSTTPTDPVAFVVVATAFLVAGVLACLGPAWRATTVDPMMALRAE